MSDKLKNFSLAVMGQLDNGGGQRIVWLNTMFVNEHLRGLRLQPLAEHCGVTARKNSGVGCPLCREEKKGELVLDEQTGLLKPDEVKLVCNGCGAKFWGDYLPEKVV